MKSLCLRKFLKDFLRPLGIHDPKIYAICAETPITRKKAPKLVKVVLYAFFFAMWQLFVMLGALGTVQVVQLIKVDPITIQVMCLISFGANFFAYICLALGIKKPEA